MKIEWIEHKEEKIISVNFNDLKDQNEMIDIMKEYHKLVKKQTNKVKTLFDMTNATLGPDFVNISKILGKENAKKLDKTALIGVTGLKTLLLKGYNLFTDLDSPATPFPSKEKALDYLKT